MIEYEVGDRVAVVVDFKVVKARVSGVSQKHGKIAVTLAKDAKPVMYAVNDVFPLYRYINVPEEVRVAQGLPEGALAFIPLFFEKQG